MSKPLEATRHHNSIISLILLPLRAIQFQPFNFDTPCIYAWDWAYKSRNTYLVIKCMQTICQFPNNLWMCTLIKNLETHLEKVSFKVRMKLVMSHKITSKTYLCDDYLHHWRLASSRLESLLPVRHSRTANKNQSHFQNYTCLCIFMHRSKLKFTLIFHYMFYIASNECRSSLDFVAF